MATQLSAEETLALVGEPVESHASGVAPRDFRQPRRISPEHLGRLKRNAQRAQQELGRLASASFRVPTEATIAAVTEANMPEIVRSLEEPFVALLFECGGQPCWTMWDVSIAVGAVERMLGATNTSCPAPRALTVVERALMQGLLLKATNLVAGTYGLEAKNPRYVQDFVSLYAAQDAQEQGDPQRLCVQIAIEGEYGAGTIRVYLYGVRPIEPHQPPAAGAKAPAKAALPQHLVDLEVQLTAELASVELPLHDVLALEPGDVIPLGVAVGSPLALFVEDEACGSARWGERHGRFALSITQFKRRSGAQPG